MNEKPIPQQIREERVVAYLLGELNSDEAKTVQGWLKTDDSLASFAEQMEATMDLVRAAAGQQQRANTRSGKSDPALPQLSEARRQILRRRFHGPILSTAARPRFRLARMAWVVPMGAAAALIVYVGMVALIDFNEETVNRSRVALYLRKDSSDASGPGMDLGSWTSKAQDEEAPFRGLAGEPVSTGAVDWEDMPALRDGNASPPPPTPVPSVPAEATPSAALKIPSLVSSSPAKASALEMELGFRLSTGASTDNRDNDFGDSNNLREGLAYRESSKLDTSGRSLFDDNSSSMRSHRPALSEPSVLGDARFGSEQQPVSAGALVEFKAKELAQVQVRPSSLEPGLISTSGFEGGNAVSRGSEAPEGRGSSIAKSSWGRSAKQELFFKSASVPDEAGPERIGGKAVEIRQEVLRRQAEPFASNASTESLAKRMHGPATNGLRVFSPSPLHAPAQAEKPYHGAQPAPQEAAAAYGLAGLSESQSTSGYEPSVRDQEDGKDVLDKGSIVSAAREVNGPAPSEASVVEREEDQAQPGIASVSAAAPMLETSSEANAISTFSLNVSDVSFQLAAASLAAGQMPEPGRVRSEEFINAFDYRDPSPALTSRVGLHWQQVHHPFAHNRDLLRFSLQTAASGREPGCPLNLVLLIDNSGSMERADRVQIIREALAVLARQLSAEDLLSVVSFARTPRLWIDGMKGGEPEAVLERMGQLNPQGGTNLELAMEAAYEVAQKHFQPSGNNRVILLTDGAANLGNVQPDVLQSRVEHFRRQGIALDCFGVGWEGYNDDLLEVLSRHGDGRYGFLNDAVAAVTEFADKLAGALHVAAADVKAQIEFNPSRVTTWRQIGYERHQLTKEQFRDNTVDAAEIGAAESGTALYSLQIDPAGAGPLGVVRVRFKVPATQRYEERAWTLPYQPGVPPLDQADDSMKLAAVAACFAEWLAQSPFAGGVTLSELRRYLGEVPSRYPLDPRPHQLAAMLEQARQLTGQ